MSFGLRSCSTALYRIHVQCSRRWRRWIDVEEVAVERVEEVAEAFGVLWPVFVHADFRGEVIGVDEIGQEGLLELHSAGELLIHWSDSRLQGDHVEFKLLRCDDAMGLGKDS